LGIFFSGVNSNKFANYWKIFQNFQCHKVGKKKIKILNPGLCFSRFIYYYFSTFEDFFLNLICVYFGGELAAKKIHWVMLVNICSKMIITDNN